MTASKGQIDFVCFTEEDLDKNIINSNKLEEDIGNYKLDKLLYYVITKLIGHRDPKLELIEKYGSRVVRYGEYVCFDKEKNTISILFSRRRDSIITILNFFNKASSVFNISIENCNRFDNIMHILTIILNEEDLIKIEEEISKNKHIEYIFRLPEDKEIVKKVTFDDYFS